MSQKEVDETDGTQIDAYMVALSEINEEGGAGGAGHNQDDKLRKALMG